MPFDVQEPANVELSKTLKPFFTFYGGKWRAAPHYPPPIYDTIVEPFAGSAGYSLRYPNRSVVLVERDPLIAATWRYLLRVRPAEILALPDIYVGETVDDCESVDDLSVPEEARCLIGWWLNGGASRPMKRPGCWMRRQHGKQGGRYTTGGGMLSWGPRVRERIASQVEAIRHWTLIEGDYEEAPAQEATWFVDPPYQKAGKHYRYRNIDYGRLAQWCNGFCKGQVIVCENVGATWLPFRPWRDIKASEAKHGGRVSREAIWLRSDPTELICEPKIIRCGVEPKIVRRGMKVKD